MTTMKTIDEPMNHSDKKPFIEPGDLPKITLADGTPVDPRVKNRKLKKSRRVSPFNRKRV